MRENIKQAEEANDEEAVLKFEGYIRKMEQGEVPQEYVPEKYCRFVKEVPLTEKTPEKQEPSERQKNLWEYREAQDGLDQATRDFYSKNFVGRSWTRLANWTGKENELSTLRVAQERFDQASNERQKHVEARLRGFLAKTPSPG